MMNDTCTERKCGVKKTVQQGGLFVHLFLYLEFIFYRHHQPNQDQQHA